MIGKIFKAYDVRATYPEPLNEEAGWKVGLATGQFLKKANGRGTVVVSRDHRPAAPSMAEALIRGLRGAGMDVIDLGRCDTSIQYFAVPFLKAVGGVQCTASHNPIQYIGYKISREQAKPVGADSGLKDIEEIACEITGDCPPPVGKLEQRDIWADYRKHILKFMGELPRPLKLFVDVCNGCGTALLDKVFRDIPNLQIIAVNNTWTDQWAHEPNPLVAENMIPTQEGVRKHKADLGACFDGDADRCMLVDDKGDLCGCDHLTALLAGHFVKDNPGTTIVYDLRSSKVVPETITALKAKPAMSKVGHVNIKALLRETDGIVGGELSGHFYFKHNNFADSGAITLATVLGMLSRSSEPLSKQIAAFRKYPQSGEINFHIDDKKALMKKLEAELGKEAEILHLDGVTIDRFKKDGWWFNLRASNTEPLVRLNAEARDQATLDKLLANLKPYLGEPAAGH